MVSSKTLVLSGLDCASCAEKIENAVGNLDGVKRATVNFATEKLIIDVDGNGNSDDIIKRASKIAVKYEPEIRVLTEEEAKAQRRKEREGASNEKGEKEKNLFILHIIGAILFAVAMIIPTPGVPRTLMFSVSYILIGGDVVWQAIKNISKGQVFDEFFLMTIATLGAFLIGDYPEAVAVMLFYQVGDFFQHLAVKRSRKSIASLMDTRPDYANLMVGEDIKEVHPEDVSVGELIVIKPGEKIPLDGIVVEGRAALDTSALTGETLPRDVKIDDEVLSGSINKDGLLTLKVTKLFGESTISVILDLVQNASNQKAKTEQFISKFARYYTPVVVGFALLLAVVPPLVIPGAVFSTWIYRALVFLVISCPCALVISVPLSYFAGIGSASKNGILVKGGNYLEALNEIGTVVFDKTGTLTKGDFSVSQIYTYNGFTEDEILKYAAYAEHHSNHPIAVSIKNAYLNANKENEIDESILSDMEEISGHGVKIKVNENVVLTGNQRLLETYDIDMSETYTGKDKAIGTVALIAVDGVLAGEIIISDIIKEDSKRAISTLEKAGIKTVMLTGDRKEVGEYVGRKLGLDVVYSELLPQQKVEKLESLEKEMKDSKKKVVFVGDGINDAPVLMRADVGIAMGGVGSDAAIEAADVVFMTDEPSKLNTARKIARKTNNIVKQNIVFALAVKAVILTLGALGYADMWMAVFGDVGVTLIAILNSMRALKLS